MITKGSAPVDKGWRRYTIPVTVTVIFAVAAYGIYSVVTDTSAPKKRVMEQIAVKIIPPPPPPPPKQEPPPPEPPKMVEQKIEPPVDKPDEQPKQDAPPPGPLALDAPAGAGGDAFGLGSKPGGSDYLIGGNGVGGNGSGNPWGRYGAMVQEQIIRWLQEDDKLGYGKYRGTIRVWLSENGKVQKVELARTTGDQQTDQRIEQRVGTTPTMPQAPSKEMPQPLTVRINATPGAG